MLVFRISCRNPVSKCETGFESWNAFHLLERSEMRCRRLLLLCLTAVTIFQPMQLRARAQTPARPTGKAAAAGPFKTPLTLDQMKNKQAVLETSAGTIIIQLLPEAAPNHVGYFMKLAREGTYNGT